MKALTLTQPWATLVALGEKRIETRSWSTPYRGSLAIHAAKGLGTLGGVRGLASLCRREPFDGVLAGAGISPAELPHGVVVATARLIGCVPTPVAPWLREMPALAEFEPAAHEREFGDYGPGRFVWLLADVVRIEPPIEARGALSLWDPPPEVLEQLAGAAA